MKSKSPLMLMEQVLMVLVFALAAAFCLQAFSLSEQLSLDSRQRSDAALLAQNAVETLKGCDGDFEEAAALLGGSWDGKCWRYEKDSLQLTVTPVDSGISGLGRAEAAVTSQDGEALFSLPAAWQEVKGNA